MTTAVIAGFARSPFHFANKGQLTAARPDDLAAAVVRALVDKTGVKPEDIEDTLVGCAFPEAEQGFNIARNVVFLAGLPVTAGGSTVNRYCGSSMTTIHMAAGAIAAGAGDVFICAGVESMTRVPMMGYNPMPNPKLMQSYPQAYMGMGETAENLAKKNKISREDQQTFAIASHKKAADAREGGRFDDEIVPIETLSGPVTQDGTIRPETDMETLNGLKPAFDANGTVTAGTSSPLTDGAAAVLVVSESYARANGIKPLAKIRAMAVAGCGAEIMGIGPVPATHKVLDRAGLKLGDIDIIELNEAFAAQSLSVIRDLEIDESKLNLDGGAIALGHPLGASGARITGKATALLQREDKTLALATMCIGGGQGIATLLERV